MPDESINEPVILIDFGEDPTGAISKGVLSTADDLAEKSAQAMDKAMETVQAMAHRVVEAAKGVAEPPSKVEITFGIKFDAAVGAMVAKAGAEASINVTLTWTKEQKPEKQLPVVGLVPTKKEQEL